ncbi:MAG: LapA family protein [Microcystaceae cyanobacterium]
MKQLTQLLNATFIAVWIGAIAVFSIQNVQGVSLKFFNWSIIQLPIGVLLAFCVGIGFVLAALFPLLWKITRSRGI